MDIMKLIALLLIQFVTMTAAVKFPSVADLEENIDVSSTVYQLMHSESLLDSTVPADFSFPGKALSSSVSSQCWRTAIEILQVALDHSIRADSAAALCSSLTEIQLKRLALEIASCHMKDVEKDMYQSVAIKELCSKTLISTENVQMCLHHLTDWGFHTYTQFLPSIQILCTRKTQEFFLDHQQEFIRNIAQNYAHIVAQSNELLALQTEQMNELFDIPILLKELVTAELEVSLNDATIQLNSILHNEAAKVNVLVTDVVDHLQQRDREHRDRMDDWSSYQASMLLQQAREMERHRSLIEEHQFKVEGLSETVAQTAKHMRPLLDLQSVMLLASDGYSWVTFLLHFLGTFNIIWIVTRLERCHEFRSYLFGLVCAEATVEIALISAVSYDLLSDVDRLLYIKELRRWALFVECFTYVFGVIVSVLNSTSRKVRANVLKASGGCCDVCCSSHHQSEGSVMEKHSKVDIDRQHILETKLGNVVSTFGPTRSGLMSSPPLQPLDIGLCANWTKPHAISSHSIDSPQMLCPSRDIPELNYPSRNIPLPSRFVAATPVLEQRSQLDESRHQCQNGAKSEANCTQVFHNRDSGIYGTAKNHSSHAVPSRTATKRIAIDIEMPSLKRSASCSLLPMESRTSKRIAIVETRS
jgi:hypothetical protein